MTQEKVINKFLAAWQRDDYKTALSLCQKTWENPDGKGKSPEHLKAALLGKKLTGYRIVSFTNVSNVKAQFALELEFGKEKQKAVANLICEEWPYKPAPFGDWGVNPVSIMNSFNNVEGPKKEPGNKDAHKPDGKGQPAPAPKKKTAAKKKK